MTRLLLALMIVLALVPDPAWAQRRGFHRHRTVVVGAFFVGPPLWYVYHYPPYYYGPYYEASYSPPAIYVEKFEGKPDGGSGEIYCPSLGQYYPEVLDCPSGWQRIIRPDDSAAGG